MTSDFVFRSLRPTDLFATRTLITKMSLHKEPLISHIQLSESGFNSIYNELFERLDFKTSIVAIQEHNHTDTIDHEIFACLMASPLDAQVDESKVDNAAVPILNLINDLDSWFKDNILQPRSISEKRVIHLTMGATKDEHRLSSLVVFAYDLLYTLPDEVEFIWKCRSVAWLYIGGSNIISPLVNIVLGLRLYALYGQSKKVLYFVSIVCVCEIAIQVVMAWDQGRRATTNMFITDPSYPLLGCLAYVEGREITLVSWVTLFVIAGIFFGMTIYRLRQSVQKDSVRKSTILYSPLYRSFVRGGAVFFLSVVVVFPISAAICIRITNPLTVSYQPWLNLALSLAGTRLILTLRCADTLDRASGQETILGMETWSARTGSEVEPISFG
ncbi:hypothetical protein BJ165DRAFT_1533344 [Panaeolus papilionaceus]|nr:hypothetical protein BJ165DRAFT_1533344 [Panaeolus papilionaceus]